MSSCGYTRDGIVAHYDAPAVHAIDTLEWPATMEATSGGGRLDTWIRVFWHGRSESAKAVAAALDPLPLADSLAFGLLEPDGDGVRAAVGIHPHQQWWIVQDVPAAVRPRRLPGDYVLGVGPAAVALVQDVSRHQVETALDLGVGGGIQSLYLSGHAKQVTGVDISPRALRYAATTAALNDLDWELLEGDMTGPVAGRRFDLVVSNPPYIVSPGENTYLYRDSGRPGDQLCRDLVAAAPALLRDGGLLQARAQWAHVKGQDWTERLATWVAGTGLDAWIVQTHVCDADSHVSTWMSDAGDEGLERRRAWLDWLAAQQIDAVGTGVIMLRAGGRSQPAVRIEELRDDRPLGPHVLPWFARQDWLRQHRDNLLDQRYAAAPGLQLAQRATLTGPNNWHIDNQILSPPHGPRWAQEVNQTMITVVGACDGATRLGDILARLADVHGLDPDELARSTKTHLPDLIEHELLQPNPLA